MLAVKLSVPHQQLNEPSNRTVQPSRWTHPGQNSVDNVIHSSEWQAVVDVFTRVGKFTPESFRTNCIPFLNLPDDVKEALREGRLSYTKARAITRVKGQQERQDLLNAAIAEDLSLNAIKERLKSLQEAKRSLQEEQPPSMKSRMEKAYTKIKKSKIWDDPKKKRQLEKLLVAKRVSLSCLDNLIHNFERAQNRLSFHQPLCR